MSPADPSQPEIRAVALTSGVGRLAIGLGLMAAPGPALRVLGFSETTAATVVAARLAGVRDIVLGGTTLAVLDDGPRLRAALLANAAADAGDVFTFALAFHAGEREAGQRGLAAALPATVAGLWAALRLRSD